MKPITLDALLMLSERDIAELFPLGAVAEGKKWKPATGKADKSLARLLKDKKARQEPKRLLGKTHGYTEIPAHALHTVPDPGEAVDRVAQEQITEDARGRFDREHQEQIDRATVRSVLAGLRQIGIEAARSGADPRLAIAVAAAKLVQTEREAA